MKIVDFLHNWMGNKDENTIEIVDGYAQISTMAQQYMVEKTAFWGIVNKIANIVSKCEFQTYIAGKPVKKNEYYLWNYKPNENQNSNEFIKELVSRLYLHNECLIFEHNGNLFIADSSFEKTENGVAEVIFSNITVKGKPVETMLYRNQVIYLKLNDENVKKILNSINTNFNNLIQYTEKAYRKSRGEKGTMSISAMASNSPNFQAQTEKLFNEDFKNYFEADNAVLPLYEGYDYKAHADKSYSNDTTRDIRALIEDVFDMTARALSFPPALAKGDVQDTSKAIDEALTICIEPLVKMIETEINAARNGKKVLQGNYIKINTHTIKHQDILEAATAIDKLIGSGVYSINGILELLGESTIDEPWANYHFITKNYGQLTGNGENITKGGEG